MTHHLKRRKKGKKGFAAIKLDMSKVYDRVECDFFFLQKMMQRLGFHENWVHLIMKCVTSVSYRIRVNGDLSEEFKPER